MVDHGQAIRYHIRKLFENSDWQSINEICTAEKEHLEEVEISFWIRSSFFLNDFEGCHDLCLSAMENYERMPSIEFCRYMLRSSIRIGDTEKILESIEIFSSHFPDDSEPKKHMIQYYYGNGDYSECIDSCNEILSKNPNHIISLRFKARSLTKICFQQQEIRDAWGSIVEMYGEDLEALNNIARSHIIDSDVEKASEVISRLFDLDPNYRPTKTTMAKLVALGGGNKITSAPISDHRVAYAKKDYSSLIKNLGGLENWKEWDDEESVFIFRSLIKKKSFQSAVDLFLNGSPEFKKSHRIASEVATAARETGDKKTLRNAMKVLKQSSIADSDASKHYLRQLIYFEKRNNIVSREIIRILESHGEILLLPVIRFILKSGRYEIIEEARISPSVSELLDPIRGSLAREKNQDFYAILWAELSNKIIHALSKAESSRSISSFNQTMSDAELYNPMIEGGFFHTNMQHHPLSLESSNVEDLCQQVYDKAYFFDPQIANKLAIFFSDAPICDNKKLPTSFRVIRISSSIADNGIIITEFDDSEKNNTKISERIFSDDPRTILGRFFPHTKKIGPVNMMILAAVIRSISERYPSEIWFDDDNEIAKLAGTILGYPGKNISHLS